MRNFALPTGPVRISVEMKSDSLHDGQVLVRAEFAQWGDAPTRLSRYHVVRVTKTRVIIRHENSDREVRLIVKDGIVSMKREGAGNSYSSFDSYCLMDLHDEELERIQDRNARREVAATARNAATLVGKEMTEENAKAAIHALSVWLVQQDVPAK